MPRFLAHLLLSVALIFQGMGAACAAGRMEIANQASTGMASMHCSHQKACHGCQGGKAGSSVTQDCMQLCSMPASLFRVVLVVPPQLAHASLPLSPMTSLIERSQVPPTPPPIA